ncbi:GNAT family N-acetyltransferase [Brachybacterium hainanense]|uniref:GNAT family N-acetyltransferase n=1 Tax=Brachybacterium hainanense TaxID=1541174 RepID=A0ABV6RCP5_9MICO
MSVEGVRLEWRGQIDDAEIVELTQAHGGRAEPGWWDRVRPHALGWVAARADDGELVGFVNVAWDGGDHAFLIDTKTRPARQRGGLGTAVVSLAVAEARAAGCEWLFVDFSEDLAPFYLDACGFRATPAGLIHLADR